MDLPGEEPLAWNPQQHSLGVAFSSGTDGPRASRKARIQSNVDNRAPWPKLGSLPSSPKVGLEHARLTHEANTRNDDLFSSICTVILKPSGCVWARYLIRLELGRSGRAGYVLSNATVRYERAMVRWGSDSSVLSYCYYNQPWASSEMALQTSHERSQREFDHC